MANDLIKSEVKRRVKSFWDTKEGTTGMIFGTGMIGLIGYGLYKLMPYVAVIMESTLLSIVCLLAIVALVYVTVIDNTLRTRLWLMYKLLMRALTYSIIKYDPVAVLRVTQEAARQTLAKVNDGVVRVRAKLEQVATSVTNRKKQQAQLQSEANFMISKGHPQEEVSNKLKKIGRLEEAIARMSEVHDQINTSYTKLRRAEKALITMDENINFEIDLQTEMYEVSNAAHEAWSALRSAFKGGGAMDELRNETLAFMADDYGQKVSEISAFADDLEKHTAAIDMQDDMYVEKGRVLLEKLNNRSLDFDVQAKLPSPSKPTFDLSGLKSNSTIDYSKINRK